MLIVPACMHTQIQLLEATFTLVAGSAEDKLEWIKELSAHRQRGLQETLMRAARVGELPGIHRVISSRAEPGVPVNLDSADKDGWTALHFAAQGGHAKIISALIATGAVDANRVNQVKCGVDCCSRIRSSGSII